MAEITASLVKELRDKTGAGMMDCKKALAENAGDLEQSVDWLRKKGLASAAKKAGRIAAEGLVGAATRGNTGALVEVNSETDFVARNATFQEYVRNVAELALAAGGDVEKLKAAAYPGKAKTVADQATELVATIGENIGVRRTAVLKVGQGVVASYVHAAAAPGLGRIGVLVGLESAGDPARLASLAKQIAMHIAATRPEAVSAEQLDPALVEREKNLLTEQAKESGKPDNVVAKMVEGRIKKFYQDVVLLEQVFVVDNESRVSQVVEKLAKELGTPVKVAGFLRFGLGEGLEKKADDFAAEVASLTR